MSLPTAILGIKSFGYFILGTGATVQSDIWLVRLATYGDLPSKRTPIRTEASC
jgi:hypothetical protein